MRRLNFERKCLTDESDCSIGSRGVASTTPLRSACSNNRESCRAGKSSPEPHAPASNLIRKRRSNESTTGRYDGVGKVQGQTLALSVCTCGTKENGQKVSGNQVSFGFTILERERLRTQDRYRTIDQRNP